MAKLFNKTIFVELAHTKPKKIFWQDKIVLVEEILEHWKDTGCWWEQEAEKDFFRVKVTRNGLLEIFYDNQKANWYLYKVYD